MFLSYLFSVHLLLIRLLSLVCGISIGIKFRVHICRQDNRRNNPGFDSTFCHSTLVLMLRMDYDTAATTPTCRISIKFNSMF